MKLRRTCKEVTRLVLQAQDRELGPVERLSLHLHWRVCERCVKFRAQAELMRTAMGRWRRYRDED
jgi:hypothetical protein